MGPIHNILRPCHFPVLCLRSAPLLGSGRDLQTLQGKTRVTGAGGRHSEGSMQMVSSTTLPRHPQLQPLAPASARMPESHQFTPLGHEHRFKATYISQGSREETTPNPCPDALQMNEHRAKLKAKKSKEGGKQDYKAANTWLWNLL